MKIAVVSAQVFACPPPGYAGLEMISWHCAEQLAQLGHEITLFAPEGSVCQHSTLFSTGPAGTWNEMQAYSKYWQELLKFDVIIDHSWQKWSYVLKGEGRLKAPVLGVLHAPVNTMIQELPPEVENPCFVCISQDQAAHFQALFSRQARHCYNGIDMDFYKPMTLKRRNRFLFLARFSTIKGPDLAMEACAKVGAELDLIGDTSITNEPELFQRCKDMADGEKIKIIGPANRGECVWWFSQNRILLHPNKLFREPFGLAPVEAQACGMPVIAWDNGAMRETVKPGATGLLVTSMEELETAITHADLLLPEGCGKLCREWASQFSIQNMGKRYEALCGEAISKGW